VIPLTPPGNRTPSTVAGKDSKLPRAVLYAVLDLGAPSSLQFFAKASRRNIQQKYPKSFNSASPLKPWRTLYSNKVLVNVLAKEIVVRTCRASNINWANKNNIEVIGTIGADLIDVTRLPWSIIPAKNFAHRKCSGQTCLKVVLSDFIFASREYHVPNSLYRAKKLLYFDTGSSAYELPRTNKLLCRMAPCQQRHHSTFQVSRGWNVNRQYRFNQLIKYKLPGLVYYKSMQRIWKPRYEQCAIWL